MLTTLIESFNVLIVNNTTQPEGVMTMHFRRYLIDTATGRVLLIRDAEYSAPCGWASIAEFQSARLKANDGLHTRQRIQAGIKETAVELFDGRYRSVSKVTISEAR